MRHHRIVVAAAVAVASTILVPAATAVPITVHEKVPVERAVVEHDIVRGDPITAVATVKVMRTVEHVEHVAPKDEDDDGIADTEDSCIGYCAPTTQYVSQATDSATGYATEGSVASGTLEAIAACESGGDPTAVNAAGYYGKYQFDLGTWASVGGSGNPAEASEAEQDMRAQMLYDQAGAAPWPVCGG